MKRGQRKANLKKLLAQNNNVEKNLVDAQEGRRTLRSAKSSALAGISNYFTTDKDKDLAQNEVEEGRGTVNEQQAGKDAAGSETFPAQAQTLKRRMNLTRFIFKNKKDIPPQVLKTENDSDDFETPVKKIKRAPKLSQSTAGAKPSTTNNVRKTKRQQKITTAFLRNEQEFSEIAAQHSIAENFNPDEVQLALALSRSELETKEALKENAVESASVEEDIRSKLKKFGYRTGTREDYTHCFANAFLKGQRRPKTKWANRFTALTLRDPAAQSQKLNANIEALLQGQFEKPPPTISDQHVEPYKVQSSMLSQHAVVDTAAQIFRNIETLSTTQHLEKFFITELFPVTKIPAGHLLKDWTTIPGRDLSPKRGHKRLSAQARKYEKFYKELEENFSKKFPAPPNDIEENVSTLEESQSKEPAPENELDGLLELIASTQHDCAAEDAVNTGNEQYLSPIQLAMAVENVEPKLAKSIETCANTQTRSTSPDIFADSDSDDAGVVEENVLNNITTYEVYSSDDVKTSSEAGCKTDTLSVKADIIVDLTQDDVGTLHKCAKDCNNVAANTPKKHDVTKRLDFFDIPIHDASPNFIEKNEDNQEEPLEALDKKLVKESIFKDSLHCSLDRIVVDSNENCSAMKDNANQEFKDNSNKSLHSNVSIEGSIDLTQSDHGSTFYSGDSHKDNDDAYDDDDDVCMLLSDDEVNYSIIKADAAFSKSSVTKPDVSKRLDFLGIPNEAEVPIFDDSPKFFEKNKDNQKDSLHCSLNERIVDSNEHCSVIKDNASQEHEDNPNEILNRNSSIGSIDLTQSDRGSTASCEDNHIDNDDTNSDDDGDDVCILLSDDEVNYSITKANAASPKSCASNAELLNNSSSAENVNELESRIQKAEEHNFSVLDLIDVERSFRAIEQNDNIFEKNTSFDLSGDIEPIGKEFLSSQFQAMACPTTPIKERSITIRNVLKQHRAEFGILESQSEPFSQTPTPAKVTPPSPRTSSTESSERYSRRSYSQKFQSFLFERQKTPNKDEVNIAPSQYDDFDEFDRLVYGSPPKHTQNTVQPDVPAGLKQLLTAEISLNAQCITASTGSQSSDVPKAFTANEEVIKINDHVYTVRVTNSPKPNFAEQTDAELLAQLYKFGIKPLKRGHAVKLLEYIYIETHPIIESAVSDERQVEIESKSDEEDSPDTLLSDNGAASGDCGKMAVTSKPNKFDLHDCNGDLLLRFNLELCAELRNDEEVYIFQTNVSKKTQQPLLPLHIAWYNLVCSSTALHECILLYEPIELQEIYLFLKSLGYRYDPKDLKRFFDRRCIIFRYDLTPPEKQANRHTRKPGKSTTNKANSQRTLHKYLNV